MPSQAPQTSEALGSNVVPLSEDGTSLLPGLPEQWRGGRDGALPAAGGEYELPKIGGLMMIVHCYEILDIMIWFPQYILDHKN